MSEIIQLVKEVQVVESVGQQIVTQIEKQVQIVEPISANVYLNTAGIVTGETPSGAVDGSNATFTTESNFVPESVELFCGGVRLSVLSDFNTSGNQTITFYVSPKTADLVRVNYQKQ